MSDFLISLQMLELLAKQNVPQLFKPINLDHNNALR